MSTAPADGFGAETPPARVSEKAARNVNGWLALGVAVLWMAAGVVLFVVAARVQTRGLVPAGVAALGLALLTLRGLTAVAPGEVRVVQLLGRCPGSVRTTGLRWVHPLTSRQRVSTRIRNHETATTKVNDADGNPIEIAAVVVWQVADTAQAVFEVDDYQAFVATQTETAVRHIAGSYPYDAPDQDRRSLRESADEITATLSAEIAARVAPGGVRVVESRITRVAYAPEIAQVMLLRQQAEAVVAARARIVDGALGMVENALTRLEERGTVDLDEQRKATMVSNLLVVLTGDRAAQPVVNAGTLQQ